MSLAGELTRERARELDAELRRLAAADGPIALDLGRVTRIDSSVVAALALFVREQQAAGRAVRIAGASPAVQRTLDLFPLLGPEALPPKVRAGIFEAVGARASALYELVFEFFVIAADTFYFLVAGLPRRRGIRWGAVLYEMAAMGSRSLGVVGLIAFLVGGTMALQSATQLRQFGANIFVVDLIGISMTRELGPLMAAIVVAGRSGSSVAAEIGTMVITEEIDALKTMGLNPIRFIVVPKSLAIAVTQPLLTVLADLLGIFGGFLVAIVYLEVGPSAFVNRLMESLMVKDILTGLVKSLMFSQLIVLIGALCGFRTQGGADAVGRSTTESVVGGIFAVIAADAIASLVFYF